MPWRFPKINPAPHRFDRAARSPFRERPLRPTTNLAALSRLADFAHDANTGSRTPPPPFAPRDATRRKVRLDRSLVAPIPVLLRRRQLADESVPRATPALRK